MSFVFSALGFSIIASAIVHYVMGAIRFTAPRRGGSPAAQAHLSILVGLAVLLKGVGYWFDRYGLEITSQPIFTGINYTAEHATLPAKTILAVIAGICALLFLANAVLRRWVVPTIGLILMVLSAIVLGIVYPGAVQYFSVKPNEPVKERPYIERNIAATRAAYGVQDVEITDYSARTTADASQLKADAEALPGIRLIDPNVIANTYDQLQQVRGYYTFPRTLDVDRYTIDGTETDAVVGVREMDQSGIEGKNWNNLKTVYTHGYGLVAAYGNRRQASGEPEWIARDIPPTGKIVEHEPRIYFGEIQRDYSIVGAQAGADAHRAGHARGWRGRQPEDLHLHRYRRRAGRQPVAPAALRREVRRRQPAALRTGEPGLEDHLRPQPARAGGEGRALADRRRRRLSRRGRGPDRLDRRRIHHGRQLSVQQPGLPERRDLRLADQPGHRGGAGRSKRSTTCATRSRPSSTPTTGP